jgi:ABC-type polysaccharide/polyol phosphate export permease
MLKELSLLQEYREFLWQFTAQQLRTRYRGSILGFLWTLINPTLTCLVLAFVFSYINKWDMRTAGAYFFAGYIPWLFFVSATTGATMCIVGNAHYVHRIYVPRSIFPISVTLVNLVDLLVGLIIVFGYMVITDVPFTPALVILPVGIVLIAVFVLGLVFLYAALNVFLRDFQFLWTSLSFLLFFFTPIIYPLTVLPPTIRPYIELSPVLVFIDLLRQPVCDGVIPTPERFALAAIYAVLAFGLGVTSFLRSERSFYLYL